VRNLLVRAIITGFGLRLGAELGKLVAHKIFPQDEKKKGSKDDDEDDVIESTSSEPPEV
jgi:hypothetical protein